MNESSRTLSQIGEKGENRNSANPKKGLIELFFFKIWLSKRNREGEEYQKHCFALLWRT